MPQETQGSHSFKLGVLAGIFLFLFLECFVSLFTSDDFRITRFTLMIVFGAAGIGATLFAYRKI